MPTFPAANPNVQAMHAEAQRYAVHGITFFLKSAGAETQLGNSNNALTVSTTTGPDGKTKYMITACYGSKIVARLSVFIDFSMRSAHSCDVNVYHSKDGTTKPSADHRLSDSLGLLYLELLYLLRVESDNGSVLSAAGAHWVGRLHPQLFNQMTALVQAGNKKRKTVPFAEYTANLSSQRNA